MKKNESSEESSLTNELREYNDLSPQEQANNTHLNLLKFSENFQSRVSTPIREILHTGSAKIKAGGERLKDDILTLHGITSKAIRDDYRVVKDATTKVRDYAIRHSPSLPPFIQHHQKECELTWGYAILTSAMVAAILGFDMLFSGMFWIGPQFYKYLFTLGLFFRFYWALSISGFFFMIIYILDIRLWKRRWLFNMFLTFALLTLTVGLILSAKEMPMAPAVVFILAIPLFLQYFVRLIFMPRISNGDFLTRLFAPFVTSGFIGVFAYLFWIVILDNYWTSYIQTEFNDLMECTERACLAGYMLYISPIIVAGGAIFFGFVCLILGRAVRRVEHGKRALERTLVRVFVFFGAILFVGLWGYAEIAGAESHMASLMLYFTSAAMIICAGLVAKSIGFYRVKRKVEKIAIIEKLRRLFRTYFLPKSCLVICLSVPFIVFLGLSYLNQLCRKMLPGIRPVEKIDQPKRIQKAPPWSQQANLSITWAAHHNFKLIQRWQWSRILYLVLILGVSYSFLMVMVGQYTTVFLSWYYNACQTLNIVWIYIFFLLLGLFMFLNPIIPGIPVYITGGLLMTKAAEHVFQSWWISLAVACFFTWLCKMLAWPMQQICIGMLLGHKKTVRRLCQVNSITIRAVKRILMKPGFHLDKVLIVIGGPDWPTAVMSGILRVSPWEMLVSCSFVAVLTIPTTLAGAFQLERDRNITMASTASTMLTIAIGTQFLSFLIALYYIEKTCVEERDSLEAEEPDKEVLEIEEKEENDWRIYIAATDWHSELIHFPLWQKINLISATAVNLISLYIFQFFDNYCFVPFQIVDNINTPVSEGGLGGNPINLMRNTGWIAIAMTGLSTIQLFIYYIWTKYRFYRATKINLLPTIIELESTRPLTPMPLLSPTSESPTSPLSPSEYHLQTPRTLDELEHVTSESIPNKGQGHVDFSQRLLNLDPNYRISVADMPERRRKTALEINSSDKEIIERKKQSRAFSEKTNQRPHLSSLDNSTETESQTQDIIEGISPAPTVRRMPTKEILGGTCWIPQPIPSKTENSKISPSTVPLKSDPEILRIQSNHSLRKVAISPGPIGLTRTERVRSIADDLDSRLAVVEVLEKIEREEREEEEKIRKLFEKNKK